MTEDLRALAQVSAKPLQPQKLVAVASSARVGAGTSAAPMQQPLNSRVRLADLQGSLRDEEAASPLATTSRVPSRTRLLAERALSPFFAPESTDSSTDPRAQPRRLVRRDSPFHQSSGKINMHRGLRAGQLLGLAQKDWYHVRGAARTARRPGLVAA